MKVETYKPSQFNYTTYNDNGELLIYNTFTSKLSKTLRENSEDILCLLKQTKISDENIVFPLLKRVGYLIPSYADEEALLHSYIENYLNSSVLEIMILPTHQCNCRCVYCYEDFKGGIMSEKVQENLTKFVKERLRSCTALHISWFGGEPLVAMDVIRNLSTQFIEICKTEHKQYTASITTNGTLLNYELIRELQKYRILTYQITIDGTRETHDAQRPLAGGGASYDLIINNLLEIKEKIRVKNFFMFLRVNITKPILATIESYIHEMEEMFGNDSRFRVSFNRAADWGGERIEDFKENILSEEDDVFELITSLIHKTETTLNISTLSSGADAGIGFSPGCHVNRKNHFTIDSTGIINKCAQQTRNDFPIFCDLSQEDFYFDEFEFSKWNASMPQKIAEKCKTCFLLPTSCSRIGGCILRRYKTKYIDNLPFTEPECPEFKKEIDRLLCMFDKSGKAIQLEGTI